MTALRVQGLCKSYGGTEVLRDVSFSAGNGVTRVLGPSGAGKTTLLRILLGLERPDSGTVETGGLRFAAVFQENRLLGQLSAEGNLRFALGSAFDAERAGAMLDALGLSDAGAKPAREYSGGMQRRLVLARALLAPSGALVLDEPFTGLDEANRSAALRCVLRAAEEKPVLLVWHGEDAALDGFPAVRLG